MIENYLPILVVFILASAFVCISLVASHYFGPKVKNSVKDLPYECGVDLIGETRVRLSIKYFLIALMFIIFDIEIVFLFPWAVVFRDFLQYGTFIFFEMVIFLAKTHCLNRWTFCSVNVLQNQIELQCIRNNLALVDALCVSIGIRFYIIGKMLYVWISETDHKIKFQKSKGPTR